MPGLLPHVDPDGLLEYSVVYTDRAVNHMSKKFQRTMCAISDILKQAYAARSAVVVPSIGSHIGVMIAAGWMELQRMASPCCAHHKATDLLWFLTAALELA